jgi:hypothetical protein
MSNKAKFKRGDYLLLLLYADNKSALIGRTRLQKIAFLFEKEILKQFNFDKEFGLEEKTMEFKPYNYGPFSKKVFDFIDFFENLGLVETTNEENNENELDTDIFIEDVSQEDNSDWIEVLAEGKMENVPVYRLTEKGEKYVEERLYKFLDNQQIEALDNIKKICVDNPLKMLLKYIYTKYDDFASESKIKEQILRETKWQF